MSNGEYPPRRRACGVPHPYRERPVRGRWASGLTGLLAGWALGFDAAVAAATGAVCVSISDQPDPLRQKPWILGWALAIAVCLHRPDGLRAILVPALWLCRGGRVFTGLWTGLISAYGKRALTLSMTGV